MNIYRIYQDVNNNWDTYDSAIVVAKNEEQAQKMNPSIIAEDLFCDFTDDGGYGTWVSKLEEVQVELIGKADKRFKKPTLILASFNAG